jgi:hypothetical protein
MEVSLQDMHMITLKANDLTHFFNYPRNPKTTHTLNALTERSKNNLFIETKIV